MAKFRFYLFMRAFLYYLFAIVFVICNSCTNSTQKNDITVSLIHINDVYEIASINKGKEGGYARLAYLVDSLKIKNPNTLVVHAGDFLSPSLIGNLKDEKGKRIKGRHMIEVMNASGVDVVTFGNHEFDIKEAELLSRIDESKFQWISANVLHQKDSMSIQPFDHNGNEILKTFQKQFVKNGDTFSLGIIGVTLPFNQKKYLAYLDVESTIEEVLDTISTDKTVLLTHLERTEDYDVAQKFTSVPLIMGGHDHYHFIDTIGEVYVAKADANLRSVWKHDLTYNFSSERLSITSELIKLDEQIPESETVLKVVNKWNEYAKKKAFEQGFDLEKVVWEGDSIWECRETIVRSRQTNFGNMVAQAMQMHSNADIVLLNSGSLRYDDQLTKIITEGDILKALPFGGSIVTTKIKGIDLHKIIKIGLESNVGTGGYLQIPNVRIENNEIWIGENKLDENRDYLVCSSEFMAVGKEARLEILESYKWEQINLKIPSDIRNFVIYYLKILN